MYAILTLIFISSVTICLTTNGCCSETSKQPSMRQIVIDELVPDVLDTVPEAMLQVIYANASVNLGNDIAPKQLQDAPKITWNANPAKMYLLGLIDPDAFSRKNHTLREFNHWMIGNIPGLDIGSGTVLSEYIGSAPTIGSDKHRYTFVLYEQPGKLAFDEKRLKNNSIEGREKFSMRNFAKKYHLGEPIAVNYYMCEWDDYVPIAHEKLGVKL